MDGVAGIGSPDIRAQGVQAVCRCFDVPVGFRAEKLRGAIRKGRQNQQPMGLGFGGDGGDFAPQGGGKKGNIHIITLPE